MELNQCETLTTLTTNLDTKNPTYLYFVEELSIKKSELISNLMAAEVVKSSRPVGTHKILGDDFNFNLYSAD